jgi:hypothetical protein
MVALGIWISDTMPTHSLDLLPDAVLFQDGAA